MPLIPAARASFVAGPKWIVAATAQDLISGSGASVEQLGPGVVREKLQSMLVSFVRLEHQRVIDRVAVGLEFVDLIEEWYRSRRRPAKPRQVEHPENVPGRIADLDRPGRRRKQVDVVVAA